MTARLLQLLAVVCLAPLVQGVVAFVRARLQGRPGPSPLQPYRDLRKLWAKESLVPEHAGAIVLLAPAIALGAALTAAALVPPVFGARPAAVDAVAVAFTLAGARFALVLAALASRSAFEGMAASREISFASIAEAPLLLALIALAAGAHGTAGGGLAAAALAIVLLFETARIPIDNQETHYELTMIHEGLVLEYTGWQLAFVQLGSQVRQVALYLFAALLLPGGGLATLAWVIALLAGVTVTERFLAKMRLFEVPHLFAAATILGVVGLALQALELLP
jgi:formate hydrogenlyase subunit 4